MLLSPCIIFTVGEPQTFRPAPDIAVQLPFRTLSQNRKRASFSRDLNPRVSDWLSPRQVGSGLVRLASFSVLPICATFVKPRIKPPELTPPAKLA